MIETCCPTCGKQYHLGDQFAGKQVRCAQCHGTFQVPASPPEADWTGGGPAQAAGAAPEASPDPPPGADAGAQFAQPPRGMSALRPSSPGDAAASPRLTQALRGTRPWVLFLAVLGFITCGLMVLGGLFFMVAGAAGGARGSGVGAIIGLLYMLMGALYAVPAFYLWNYGSRIGQFLRSGSMMMAESALEAQKSFWKFVGIMTLIVIGVYVVALLVVVIGAVAVRL